MKFFLQLPKSVYIVFVFVFTLVIWRVVHVGLGEQEKGRDSIHGDSYSDRFAHSAAMYFHDFGFKKTCGLPVLDYQGNFNTEGTGVYTHYPTFHDAVNGITAIALNTKSDRLLRITPVLFSIVFFFLIFYTLITILPQRSWAISAGIILVLSNYFIAWADNLHKHLYEEFFKWLYVLQLYLYFEKANKNKLRLVILSILFVIIANVSFDGILFAVIATIGFSLIYRRTIFTKEVFILAIAATFGLSLHLLQNINHFGTVQLALVDLKNAFFQRSMGETEIGYINELQRPLVWYDPIKLLFIDWPNRIERFFLIPGWALIIICGLSIGPIRQNYPKLFKILICLLIATFLWSLLMVQHTLVHIFNTRHIGLLYALVLGCCLPIYFERLKIDFQKTAPIYLKIVHSGLLSYIVVMALSQQVFDLYIRYGFAYPYFGK